MVMKDVLLVGLGSAVGGMLRYLVGLLVTRCPATCTFPWATLVVNWGGCLLLGMFLGAVARGNPIYAEWRPLLCAGFCGGFTTFSTFSAEALALLREGETGLFVLYLAASILGGLLLMWGGLALSRIS